jgi:hypothetical protein
MVRFAIVLQREQTPEMGIMPLFLRSLGKREVQLGMISSQMMKKTRVRISSGKISIAANREDMSVWCLIDIVPCELTCLSWTREAERSVTASHNY